jgi:hypothetical protein
MMPWEIDYALLSFTQLKKSKYHLSEDVNVIIDSVLNLSSYNINWEESKLPKEYFIEKYNTISMLLCDYNHNKKIYEGDKLYGHLNLQRECIEDEIDYYIGMCPDMYFSEYLLHYLIESAKQITNKYFVITPQICKFWDNSWDIITNSQYLDIKNEDWYKSDVFDVDYNNKHNQQDISLKSLNDNKFAGWFDLYNKAFYEELCPSQEDWEGYGGWDLYSLITINYIKQYGVDFMQYNLQGETIFEYSVGPLFGKDRDGFSKYYKNLLVTKNTNEQRQSFESKIQEYVSKNIKQLKEKNIL